METSLGLTVALKLDLMIVTGCTGVDAEYVVGMVETGPLLTTDGAEYVLTTAGDGFDTVCFTVCCGGEV